MKLTQKIIFSVITVAMFAFIGSHAFTPDVKAAGDAEKGKELYTNMGCIGCHSIDGSALVGPSFKGLAGKKQTVVTDGKEREITVDDAYLVTSMKDPDKDVVKGFTKGQMPPLPLSDDDIAGLIAYIKTLK